MGADVTSSLAEAGPGPTRWGAFGHSAFTIIWSASVISNVGIAFFDTASGWFMANLSHDPMVVSLVQVATSLPLFLFTLPAGALTDIVDPRRLLFVVGVGVALVSTLFAALVSLHLATPNSLLGATFLLGIGGALSAPAWVSISPLLVPRRDLAQAIAANTVGYNLSRAVGPALGGFVIGVFGIAAPFWIYGVSNVAVLAALLWWREPPKVSDSLPAERLFSALRTGIRHANNNLHLRATLMRAVAFFPFASAYWALLPLVAHAQMTQGPEFYGLLLGFLGVGAIGGSLVLRRLKKMLGADGLVAVATVGTALALVLFGLAHDPATALAACFIAGATWTLILSTLYVSAQVALPDWVRGRGLAVFLTVIFGASTVGSALWGHIAGIERLVDRALRGSGRRCSRHSADLAMEAADRARGQSHALPALASAICRVRSAIERGTCPGFHRISHQKGEPDHFPDRDGGDRTRTQTRRRLCLEGFRRFHHRREIRRDVLDQVVARAPAPARTRHRRRSDARGPHPMPAGEFPRINHLIAARRNRQTRLQRAKARLKAAGEAAELVSGGEL